MRAGIAKATADAKARIEGMSPEERRDFMERPKLVGQLSVVIENLSTGRVREVLAFAKRKKSEQRKEINQK